MLGQGLQISCPGPLVCCRQQEKRLMKKRILKFRAETAFSLSSRSLPHPLPFFRYPV